MLLCYSCQLSSLHQRRVPHYPFTDSTEGRLGDLGGVAGLVGEAELEGGVRVVEGEVRAVEGDSPATLGAAVVANCQFYFVNKKSRLQTLLSC